MGAIRAAIWAAVSTETQAAEDKVSLPAQQELCRALVASRGWEETAGPYVVAGASRTRWVNLRDAEQAIPELRAMLNDAQAGRFNLLLLFDFNRLRDLLDPVARTLSAYGCQILSVPQPVESLPADSTRISDSSSMMQD
jgi:DNA invertase Pin-like site-specific DNA recombinase